MKVLKAALAASKDLLFIEDDLLLSGFFTQALNDCYKPTVLCVLAPECINDNVLNAFKSGGTFEAGLYEMRNLYKFFGSQCVFIPLTTLQSMAKHKNFDVDSGEPIDYFFRDFFIDSKEKLYSFEPNPVQHVSPPSLVNPLRRKRFSLTFRR